MTENKAAHDLLGSVDPPAIVSTPERPTSSSSSPSKASKTQLKSQIPLPEAPEASIPISSDDKPTAVESKSIPVERRLSTISLYDKEHADSKEPKTRSSIGRDSVRLNAKARVPSLKNQKAGFDKTIGFTAKKEKAEKELKRRKKAYYHLSTKEDHEITADWPSPEEKTWEQWKEVTQVSACPPSHLWLPPYPTSTLILTDFDVRYLLHYPAQANLNQFYSIELAVGQSP